VIGFCGSSFVVKPSIDAGGLFDLFRHAAPVTLAGLMSNMISFIRRLGE
jgi:hypothetical protein